MGYLAKGDRITQTEQDLVDIIGTLGSPLQVLRVTADGLSLEYATAGGDMVLSGVQSVTGLKTFDKDKIAMKGTSTGVTTLSTANTGASNYTATLQASDGTIAYLSDIPVISGFATIALDNLASVAINTSLISDTDNTDDLGSAAKKWANLFVTTIGATGTRVTKGWFTDIESTNLPTVNGGTLASALSLGTMASETATNYVAKSLYDAHSVLYATSDNTPLALTVGEQTVVGRVTSGNIAALSIDSDLSSVSANHDTIPSAKATKAYADLMLPLTGGTMSGNITLGENVSIALDPAGSADGKYTGLTVTGTAGYAQTFGDLVYLDPTDSRWEKTDANAASGADGDSRGLVGIVVVAGAADGNACTILLKGIIRADAAFPAFTINNPIYISETAGAVTQTQPTTTDAVIRLVGAALTADEMYFNPEWDWIAHT